MKNLILFACILISNFSFSQDWNFDQPDYKEIEKNIQEENSNLLYETLLNRFFEADSTMNLHERRHLYYGYVFHENYSPYSRSGYSDSLRVVLQKEELDSLDLKKIITISDKILVDIPFDLSALNYQLYALEQTGDKANFDKKLTQLRIIIDALMSSGNGKSKEEAYYVIYTSHEYDLLGILGFQFGGSQSLIEHYDYLTIEENEAKLEGMYFDVSPCLNSLSKMIK